MSVGLEKTEQQLEKAYNELSVIRDRKADIIEKEKAVMAHIEKLENQRILQIVGIFNLNGDDLKKKLTAIMPANALQTDSDELINNERTDEDE
jgi:acetolactate synthase small subunit